MKDPNIADKDQEEYRKFIKDSFYDGSYFKDARDWYIFRYVTPICDRTWLFMAIIILFAITYILSITIINSLPIKQEVPIVIKSKDQSLYFPVIKSLNNSIEISNIDEAVSRYLLIQYLENREQYDLRNYSIKDLNKRLNYIKNNSSDNEYRKYQQFLSKINKDSPINYWGKDYQRIINITSVQFPKEQVDDFLQKARKFLSTQIPKQAEILFTITTKVNSNIISSEKLLVKVDFNFSGVDSKNKNNSKLLFKINSYKLYRVK